MLRYDRAPFKATRTDSGFLLDSPILTRTGVFKYAEPGGRIRREYRPASVVFAQDSLAKYKAIPITDGHPGAVTHQNVKQHIVGSVLSEGRQDGESLTADIVIYDQTPLLAGKRELSVGYRVTLDENPGVSPEGEEYDVAVTGIFPNHLAIVAKGRAGTARLNLDAADAVVVSTEDDEPIMTTVKHRLDSGIEYDVPPEVAVALAAQTAAIAAQKTRADAAEAARDGMQAKIDAHAAALTAARADGAKDAAGRLKLESDATGLGVKFAQDAKDADIRVALIKHVRGDSADLTGKSDAYVEAAYDLALADGLKAKTNAAGNRAAMGGGNGQRADSGAAPEGSAASARAKMVAGYTTTKTEA